MHSTDAHRNKKTKIRRNKEKKSMEVWEGTRPGAMLPAESKEGEGALFLDGPIYILCVVA